MKQILTFLMFLTVSSAAFADRSTGRWALVLAEPPVAEAVTVRAELRTSRGTAARARVTASQSQVRNLLAKRKITVLGSVDTIANAIFVDITDEQAQQLRSTS